MMSDVILLNDHNENDKKKKLNKKKQSSNRSSSRGRSRKSDGNLKRTTRTCNKPIHVEDSTSSRDNNDININSLKRFGLDFNLSEETLTTSSSCNNIKNLSSSCNNIKNLEHDNNINIDDIMDPRRWSSIEDYKILNREQEQEKEQEPIATKTTKTSKPKKTSRSGGGPRFVPPKSNDFVPPCSYIPELPRWNFLDRLSEEVAPPAFFSTKNKSNSSSRRRIA